MSDSDNTPPPAEAPAPRPKRVKEPYPKIITFCMVTAVLLFIMMMAVLTRDFTERILNPPPPPADPHGFFEQKPPRDANTGPTP